MHVDRYFCESRLSSKPGQGEAERVLLKAMAVSHDVTRDGKGEMMGDPTEIAMLRAVEGEEIDPNTVLAEAPRVAEVPFDSGRKRMTTIHRQSDGTFLSITKGAAEVIIQLSERSWREGSLVPIARDEIAHAADQMAADGLRVLGIGVRHWTALPEDLSAEVVERDLEFLGLFGLIDPPRPEVREAIATCAAAGIIPVMITGDHPLTARAVARRLGLIRADRDVLSGPQLAALSDERFAERVRDVRVYARVAPEQKVRIVRALQDAGEVVAMTGDGVNDAPALKSADVGVAMGIQGNRCGEGVRVHSPA